MSAVGMEAESGQQRDGDWSGMLAARPHRNTALLVERRADGSAIAEVPRETTSRRAAPWRWIVPVASARRVSLDRLGFEVFDLCDGVRDVAAVVDEFAGRHGLTFHESRSAVTAYLKELVRRGVLAIELREAGEADRCQ